MGTMARLMGRVLMRLDVQMHLKEEDVIKTSKEIDELMEIYDAEVFQDIHAPAWQRKLRELSRRKKEAVIEAENRKAIAHQKVAAMDDGSPIKPVK